MSDSTRRERAIHAGAAAVFKKRYPNFEYHRGSDGWAYDYATAAIEAFEEDMAKEDRMFLEYATPHGASVIAVDQIARIDAPELKFHGDPVNSYIMTKDGRSIGSVEEAAILIARLQES